MAIHLVSDKNRSNISLMMAGFAESGPKHWFSKTLRPGERQLFLGKKKLKAPQDLETPLFYKKGRCCAYLSFTGATAL
jgi:hypothetical protein